MSLHPNILRSARPAPRPFALLPRQVSTAVDEFDLVVADASWTWTQRLFEPLADLGARVLLLHVCDWRNAMLQRRPLADWAWPLEQLSEHLWRQTLILPPGWMKSYPALGMRPIAGAVRRWRSRLGHRPNLALAIAYPHYLELHRQLRPDRLIYYNMDDYGYYWPRHADAIASLEQQTVATADVSIACAQVRARAMRRATPSAAARVIHLPHGAPESWIPAAPAHRPSQAPDDLNALPRPYLGFVGSLEDRIDWRIVADLARALPQATIVLIGRIPKLPPRARWGQECRAALALPNVVLLGWRPQEQITKYVASFDVALIPYRVDHPFNQRSCPTKLLDYLATSRPVVTTALPECQLYDRWFHVVENSGDFLNAVRAILDQGGDDGRAEDRWTHARANTWRHRAAAVWNALSSVH